MKVLIVRTFPNIIDLNGYNVQEIGLAKALTRLGHECGIVFYYGKHKSITETISVLVGKEEKNITIYRVFGLNFLKNGIFPGLKRIIDKYDVVQVHEYDQLASWYYYSFIKKPVVIYHGPYYDEFNKGYNFKCKIFDNVFLKIKRNSKIYCMTKSRLAAEFMRTKGFEKVIPVGVGIDKEQFGKIEVEKILEIRNRDKKEFLWLYVGKLEERRNSIFLILLMKMLADKYNDMKFCIIGNGKDEYVSKCLQEAKELLDSGRLTYIPALLQNELKQVYLEADAMLFPSQYEIFGMVIIEALSFLLPVISSKNGGTDMIIEHGKNGIIVDDFNLESWLKCAEELYQNKELRNSISRNLKDSSYEWDDIALKMQNIYERALYEYEK